MLRMNLATRPFYNERAVHLFVGLIAALGIAFFVAGGLEMARLARDRTETMFRVEQADLVRAELISRTEQAIGKSTPDALDALNVDVQEVSELIDRRVFSWTAFFNLLEESLPEDVRVTELRPEIADGAVSVSIGVLGRDLATISDFVQSLERSGDFRDVLTRQAELSDQGIYRATIQGRYLRQNPEVTGTNSSGEGAESPR